MSILLDIAYGLAGTVSSPVWGYRLWRTGKWRTDWAARLGKCPPVPHDKPTVLIHAVSVGEVNAIRLLVDKLDQRAAGQINIVIGTTTDTGTARARQLFLANHRVVRYPLDFTFSVKRFLNAVKPDAVMLVELEVWPNFVAQCARRKIPVCVANGRLSLRSFERYRLIKPLLHSTFTRLSAVAAQTEAYAARFRALGAKSQCVHVLDTMKWDTAQVGEPQNVPGTEELARAMGIDRARPLIVAGSTAPGEDQLLINTCPDDAQLLIVPRKPEWFGKVVRLAPDIIRRSRCPDGAARPINGQRLFLLDTMGELRKAYALADIAIVGRSFLGLYGSDMMEPIALGKPTIIGPHYDDFADIMAALLDERGIEVTPQPGPAAAALLADPDRARRLAENGRRVILSRQGATARHVELLLSLLPPL